jgi:hypothetical protein
LKSTRKRSNALTVTLNKALKSSKS